MEWTLQNAFKTRISEMQIDKIIFHQENGLANSVYRGTF